MRIPDVSKLRSSVQGSVLTPDSSNYHESTRLFNAAIVSEPAVLVYCVSADDVAATLDWAHAQSIEVVVRSGGCCVTGFSTNIGGIVIDVSRINHVEIDPTARTARVGGGVQLDTLYTELSRHDLVIPGGECAMVGVSGLTLGGGISLIGRSHGFTVDALTGVELVLASGETVYAGPDSHEDLFWALRGGGGSFGVATELHFRLSPLPSKVPIGVLMWPEEQAPEALATLLDYFHEEAPDELDAMLMLTAVPYQKQWAPVLVAVVAYAGEPGEADPTLTRLRSLVPTAKGEIAPASYHKFLHDSFNTNSKARPYEFWKSAFVGERLPADAIEHLVTSGLAPHEHGNLSPACLVSMELCGGAMNRVGRTDTAFVHRDQRFLLGIFANSVNAANRSGNEAWARGLYNDLSPTFSGEHYQNYPDLQLPDFRTAYYAENYERLLTTKRRYDPGNVFKFAQSIGVPVRPAAAVRRRLRPGTKPRPRPDDAPDP